MQSKIHISSHLSLRVAGGGQEMLAERRLALTALAGRMVVVAAATDEWETARPGFARFLGRGDAEQTRLTERLLEETREQLIGAAAPSAGQIHATLAAQWAGRLAELLEENPEAEAELQALVRDIQTAPHAEMRSASSPTTSANGVADTTAATEPAPEHPSALAARSETGPARDSSTNVWAIDDREVVAAIRAGDQAGIAAAYDKYAAALYGYCYWRLRQPADAAEALLDIFLTVATAPGDLTGGTKLRPWLYSIARKQCQRRFQENHAAGYPKDAAVQQDTTVSQQIDATMPMRAVTQLTDATMPMGAVTQSADSPRQPTDDTVTFSAVGQPIDSPRESADATMVFRAVPDSPWPPTEATMTFRAVSRHLEQPGLGIRASLPPELREPILRVCFSAAPDVVAYRRRVVRRAELRPATAALVLAGWVVAVCLAAAVLFLLAGSHF